MKNILTQEPKAKPLPKPKVAIEAGNIVIEWPNGIGKKQVRIWVDPNPAKLDEWIPDLKKGFGHQLDASDLRARIDRALAASPNEWHLSQPPPPPRK